MVSELIELSSVIGDIYDAAIEPPLWQHALASICAYIGGQSAVLYWHDAATVRSEALHLFNENAEYTKLYFEKYLPMNPMFPAATFVDAGVVTTTDDIMPRVEFEETRFYKEWVRPQGMEDALSVNLEKGVTRTSLINVRTDVVPSDEMRQRMSALVPHLQRAVAIGRLFEQSRAKEEALTEAFDHVEAAVFLVGADGEIRFANDAARKLLDVGSLVREQGGVLRAAASDADNLLRDVYATAAKGDASVGVRGVAVPLSNSEERWFAHALPLTSGRRRQAAQGEAAVAAVLVRKSIPDAPPPLEALANVYKLTAGEVRVLDAVLKVRGIKAMAETLGLSQATVKTHLHNVFRKTGTTRQSDLVKLVAGI